MPEVGNKGYTDQDVVSLIEGTTSPSCVHTLPATPTARSRSGMVPLDMDMACEEAPRVLT